MSTIPIETLVEKWMKDPEFKKEYDKLGKEFGEKMSNETGLVKRDSVNGSVQTRSEETGFCYFDTVQEALDHAKKDETVWKISFKAGEERLRLVRQAYAAGADQWVLFGTQGADPEFGAKLDVLILIEKFFYQSKVCN